MGRQGNEAFFQAVEQLDVSLHNLFKVFERNLQPDLCNCDHQQAQLQGHDRYKELDHE